MIPSTEYDALCEMLTVICDEFATDDQAVELIRHQLGTAEADMLENILAGQRANELFGDT
jgi:hypothetical protein